MTELSRSTRIGTAVLTAASYFFLSYVLFNVWLDPMAWDDGRWVPFGVGLLLLEFIALHSGGFVGALASKHERNIDRIKFFGGLFAFYAIVAWAFSVAFASPEILLVFGAVMLSRLVTIVTAVRSGSTDAQRALLGRSAFGILIYMGVGAFTVFVDLPEMGITPDVVREVYPGRGGGIWERHPERPIVGGAIYFAIMGAAELFYFSRPGSNHFTKHAML